MLKPFSELRPEDLNQHPVWEFANDIEGETNDETVIRPIDSWPIESFANRLVGTVVELANGDRHHAVVQNIDLQNPFKTKHFLTLTVFDSNRTAFPLARYFDIHRDQYGPRKLAEFLHLSVDEVFPIAYDISEYAVGDHDCVRGRIDQAPRKKLARKEILKLAIEPE